MSEALWSWSATEVVEKLRANEITARDVLRSLQERIAAVDGMVNALPTLCFERAYRRAAELEAKEPADRGIFAGLPVPIKDTYEAEGVRTTWGSLAFADHVATRSDYLVEAIEAADGIVYAKSNTPEFQAGANTFNDVFGPTLNPWSLSRSAGGSSGGAAAAVATGMAHIAQGSDNACSIRYPAAFGGVVGLRPTPGVVPQGPSALPHQVLSVIGPIARSVADVGLGLDGMHCFDARDPLSRPSSGFRFHEAARSPRRPARAALSMDIGIARVANDVRKVVEEAVVRLADAGLAVSEDTPDLSAADKAYRTLRSFQFAALTRDTVRLHRDKIKPEVIWNTEEGLKLTASDLAEAEAFRAEARGQMLSVLHTHGFLITPTAPVAPFPVDERYVEEIEGVRFATYIDWLILGYAVTVTGCPAISIPCGLTRGGLPVGLQIVGEPYEEANLLSAAAWCEAVLGASLARPVDPRGHA
jgi:amidase